MTNKKSSALWFVVIPALAMWLGWGVRGLFGHANGAMTPGALVALAVCFLLKDKRISPGLAVGLTAIGFGFGADETTLQSAGYLGGSNPDHIVKLGLAYPGLALKGGLWAMFGGAALGLALAAYLYRKRDIVIGAILMIAAFYLGWFLINRPRLIYFSYDRNEIWGGLLFGVVTLLTWLTIRGGTRIPLKLAGWAALGGAIGYPTAVTLSVVSRHAVHHGAYDFWKLAETTFGAFMGASIGIGTYLVKDQLPSHDEAPEPAAISPSWIVVLVGALGVVVANTLYGGILIGGTSRHFHNIMPWILLGPVLLCVAFYWPKASWHIGVTMAFFANAADLLLYWRHDEGVQSSSLLWILIAAAMLLLAWKVCGWYSESDPDVARKAFLWLMWAVLVPSYLLIFINHKVLNPPPNAIADAGGRWPYLVHAWGGGLMVAEGFTVVAIILSWLFRSQSGAQKNSSSGIGKPRVAA